MWWNRIKTNVCLIVKWSEIKFTRFLPSTMTRFWERITRFTTPVSPLSLPLITITCKGNKGKQLVHSNIELDKSRNKAKSNSIKRLGSWSEEKRFIWKRQEQVSCSTRLELDSSALSYNCVIIIFNMLKLKSILHRNRPNIYTWSNSSKTYLKLQAFKNQYIIIKYFHNMWT